ncbi:MAG: metallophosphoesterase [Oscillospiraceae bacterium]|nr:metallophosphoesterase [Oscillospiraceae bacterium]
MKRKLLIIACVLAAAALLAVGVLLHRGNTRLTVSEYTLTLPSLPAAFDGLRVVQISDLHDACFGENQSELAAELAALKPDIVVFTGDLFDYKRLNLKNSLAAAEAAVNIAPCYYAPGNHEQRRPVQYAALIRGLKALGVTVLDDAYAEITRGGSSIRIAGARDISFYEARYSEEEIEYGDEHLAKTLWLTQLKTLCTGSDFTLLLSHHPEYFAFYSGVGAQLVFSGHTHGGQFRLPFVGGLFAPGQGILPEYSEGVHTHQNTTTMVVSRGLGNSAFPLRVNNPPELVLTVLHSAQETP